MDGDDADEEGDATPEDLDDQPADGGDPLDDSTGEEDPIEEIETSGAEGGWLEDAGDSDALDVGTPETFGTEEEGATLLEGADEPDVGEEELSIGAEDGSEVADSGEEGFEDEEEDLREEDLPRLDSDHDDVESDDPDLLDGLPEEDASEESRPPWDDRAWERVDDGQPPSLAPVTALAIGPDGLIVGGEGLARIDPAGGGRKAIEAIGLGRAAPRAIAREGDLVFVSTPHAGVLVSEDAGGSFRPANGWRDGLGASEAVLEIACSGIDLWARASGGSVVWSGDRGASWTRVLIGRRVDAIGVDATSGHLVALSRAETGTTISRGPVGCIVTSNAGPLPAGKILSLAAHDGRVTVALARGAFRLEDGVWSRLDGTAGLTAMTFARGDGSLVIALSSEGEGRAWILEARAGAPAFTVAEMGDAGGSANEEGDGVRVRALCWDSARGVVWAGGGFGLIALRPARR